MSEESMKVPELHLEEQQALIDRENIIQQFSTNNYKDFMSTYSLEKNTNLNILSNKLD